MSEEKRADRLSRWNKITDPDELDRVVLEDLAKERLEMDLYALMHPQEVEQREATYEENSRASRGGVADQGNEAPSGEGTTGTE